VGTLLAMNGSDGISLDGMYHEEHALPSFVHARSKDQLRLPMSRSKMETPVIYFYTPQVRRVGGRSRIPDRPLDTVVPAGVDGQTRDRAGRFATADARRQHQLDGHVRPPSMKHNEPPRPTATRCGTTHATSTRRT
jgi:hypothetical protein